MAYELYHKGASQIRKGDVASMLRKMINSVVRLNVLSKQGKEFKQTCPSVIGCGN